MQICGDDGLGLDVDKVLAAVGLDAQRQEGVRVDVPEQFAEEAGAAVAGAPGGVA